MTNAGTGPASVKVSAATRRTMVRVFAAAAIMAGGYAGSVTLEKSLHLTFDKPPMPLSKPLFEMSKQLGGRYVAEGPDEIMDEETVDVLGTKDYLLRTYMDTTKHAGDVGQELKLNLNYYATGNASPHVPEICWAGNGMNEASSSRRYFDVQHVKRLDGTEMTLRMRLISFLPKGELAGVTTAAKENDTELLNVGYVFEVNGNYVATPQDVSSQFWRASAKHAYHTKIEVTVPDICTQEEAIAAISDYIRAALPAVEECLPAHDSPGTDGAVGTKNEPKIK
jgi:hypothetical protein